MRTARFHLVTVCAAVLFSLFSGRQVLAGGQHETLVKALAHVESGNKDSAIGDKKLKNKAYGCLQIRKPVVDDVNNAYGTSYTAEDCLNNRELSIWIFEKYMELYATEARIGRTPTDEDRARIWNGGPNGYKKDTTKKYWAKVKKELA